MEQLELALALFNHTTSKEPTRYKLSQSKIVVVREHDDLDLYLSSPQSVQGLVKAILTLPGFDDDQEHFLVICVNTKNRFICYREMFRGAMDRCVVSAKEVFRYALLAGAAKIILAHNHPSGEVEPSEQDKTVTRGLYLAGVSLDLKIIDHVIIGNGTNDSFSFMDNHLI